MLKPVWQYLKYLNICMPITSYIGDILGIKQVTQSLIPTDAFNSICQQMDYPDY